MKKLRFIFTIALPLILFVFIAASVISHNTTSFDSYVYKNVSSFISFGLTNIMQLMSFFGSGEFLVTVSFILIIAVYKKEKYSFYAGMIIINLFLSSIINLGFKYLAQRQRPDILRLIDIGGYSFPSGHSMVSMSFYGFLIYLCCKYYKTRWKYLIVVLFATLILTIGLSRIYLGVHYASDVVGGFSLGVLWLGIYSIIVDIRYRKKHANCR